MIEGRDSWMATNQQDLFVSLGDKSNNMYELKVAPKLKHCKKGRKS